MESFVGEIRAFGFPYVPQGWASCNGQLIPIRQQTALFSLIGLAFGGDGSQTFGLPNLNGNLAVGTGQRPGGSNWQMGQIAGSTSVTLQIAQMAAHSHGLGASTNQATGRSAQGNELALAVTGDDTASYDALIYASAGADVQLAPQSLASAGGAASHTNMMPSQVLNYCICLQGIFPQFP